MDSRVLEVLSSQLEEQVTALKDHLAIGQATDYAQYRELCGKLHGLLLAQRITSDLQRNLEQEE
jgi:hypothetical protein